MFNVFTSISMSEDTSLTSSKSRQTCDAVNIRSREDAIFKDWNRHNNNYKDRLFPKNFE